MKWIGLIVYVTILGVSFSGWATIDKRCEIPAIKHEVFFQVKRWITLHPRPYVNEYIGYNQRMWDKNICCVEYKAEPHPDKPNCFAAYRTLCYDLDTHAINDRHTYNGWCDY